MRNFNYSFAEILQRTQKAVLGSDPALKLQWAIHPDKNGCFSLYLETLPGWKRVCYYRYKSESEAQAALARMLENTRKNRLQREYEKSQRKAERARWLQINKDKVQVGDIYACSWGYEQTNIDFYQVVDKKGCFIWIRELAQKRNSTEWEQGTCVPIKDHFLEDSKTLKKRISDDKGGYIRINSFSSCWPWDGRPEHYTSYA